MIKSFGKIVTHTKQDFHPGVYPPAGVDQSIEFFSCFSTQCHPLLKTYYPCIMLVFPFHAPQPLQSLILYQLLYPYLFSIHAQTTSNAASSTSQTQHPPILRLLATYPVPQCNTTHHSKHFPLCSCLSL